MHQFCNYEHHYKPYSVPDNYWSKSLIDHWGKIEVHRRLQKNDYDEPRLRIFSTCTNLVRTLPTLPIAKTNSEDVDTHAEDHAYDALRYMVMTRQTNLPRYTQFSSDLTKKYKPVDEVFGY